MLWFRDQVLKTPVRRDKSELRGFQSDAARNIVFLRARHDSYNQRMREFLRKSRPAWPSLSETAAALNTSSSTLQRHLQAESYSFQSVKDELRRDIAISLLQTTAQPLNLIAEALGFSDSAAFQRAFKLWTGTPAGLYRRGVDQ